MDGKNIKPAEAGTPCEPKIALCMIAGNEASIIVRCLESAAPAFDKLCLVHAVGEATPDRTLEVAWRWCEENRKEYAFEIYKNRPSPGGAPLKHVDDFGAARNLSFELAAGGGVDSHTRGACAPPDWILWLDCDDYLDELNCRRIREAVRTAPPDWNGLFCSYLVERQGAVIQRERLIRQGKGRWKNAIHETCVIEGPSGDCPQVQIFHSEHSAKHHSSAARNMAILDRVLEDAPRHYFYLHAELKMLAGSRGGTPGELAGEDARDTLLIRNAIRAARGTLELLGEDQIEERYMVHLNLSELLAGGANEPERTVEHLLEAVRLQPHRREAFAYLCQKSLIDGYVTDAISYFRLMDALPSPSPLPWTHQGIWYPYPGRAISPEGGPTRSGQCEEEKPKYGWARNLLRVRVLRASRNLDQAEREHAEFLKDPEYASEVAEYERKQAPRSASDATNSEAA